jgi:hypothetical protein
MDNNWLDRNDKLKVWEEELEEQFFFRYHLHIPRDEFLRYSKDERQWIIKSLKLNK